MRKYISAVLASSFLLMVGCQPNTGNVSTNQVNTNVNLSNAFNGNTNTNGNTSSVNTGATISETKEPEVYQAAVVLKMQATGENSTANLPSIQANVARNGEDRRMEFNLPNAEKVIYLDKAGTNYLILPNRKQYAELDKQSLGFEVRRLMMPSEIVNQVKNVRGVERVGEENVNGRQVIRYRFGSVANTQSAAGQVATESFFLIDKETGLPLVSETVSQAQGNVQGYKGMRFITEMNNIKTETTPDLFAVPTDYAKIDAAQVKSQVELIFNTVGMLIANSMKSAQTSPTANSNTNSNMATPAQ